MQSLSIYCMEYIRKNVVMSQTSDTPHMGFSVVLCGTGLIAQAHSTREFVPIELMSEAVKMYLLTVLELLGID